MQENKCIFCRIVKGEIKSYVIWEDSEYVAFLTPFPNMVGMTIVAPKKHTSSYVFDVDDPIYSDFLKAVKTVGKLLDKKLGVARCALVFEGTGIDHLHAKLYPLHGPKASQTDVWSDHKIFFPEYPGYLSTVEGPEMDSKELEKLAKKIRE